MFVVLRTALLWSNILNTWNDSFLCVGIPSLGIHLMSACLITSPGWVTTHSVLNKIFLKYFFLWNLFYYFLLCFCYVLLCFVMFCYVLLWPIIRSSNFHIFFFLITFRKESSLIKQRHLMENGHFLNLDLEYFHFNWHFWSFPVVN